ncbi:MAG: Gfo/Idh/MocA family oxidoreductase [Clostridiales bacterium]|nr:Gfo/Idh/MocA family oxidoreductase [Clostridiales bacterium]
MANETLKSAIAGCGNIHSCHAEGIEKCENASLYAVCDIIKERADASAKRFGCKAFYSFDELIADGGFDVLHICTPHYLHAQMALEAMAHGKHVLTEKPIAISIEDAEGMIAASKKHGVSLAVNFQNRYNESSRYIKKLLSSGALGKVKGARAFVVWDRDESYYNSAEWRGTWSMEGGGVLINQALHTVDLMQWLIGESVAGVKGSISTKRLSEFIEVEDTADALITFESGTRLVIYATLAYAANSPILMEFVCENGMITVGSDIRVSINGKPDEVQDINHIIGEKGYWGTGHSALIADFYDSIINKRRYMIDGEEGIKALKIVEEIYARGRG